MDWMENDELFEKELRGGYKWQLYVAKYLRGLGFDVKVPKFTWRESADMSWLYTDEPDILCCGKTIEVKSRKYKFTSPSDFPFQTVLVETISGWNAKRQKPHAYINVSTITGAMIALSGYTKPLWTTVSKFDRTRKIRDRWYEAKKELWKPIDALIEALNKIKGD